MSSPSQRTRISVSPDGVLTFIYKDELLSLHGLGQAEVRRASYVEPARDGSGWEVSLWPMGGMFLGIYAKRAEALAAEATWLERNVL